MKKYINILSALFILVSCASNMEYKVVSILFYPSSGGDYIYSITLKSNFLLIVNNEPKDIAEVSSYKRELSIQEIHEVRNLIKQLQKRRNLDTEIILDSWRVEVIVDGVRYYNKSGVNLETLPIDIKQLIEVLIKGSTVEIDLYGFS